MDIINGGIIKMAEITSLKQIKNNKFYILGGPFDTKEDAKAFSRNVEIGSPKKILKRENGWIIVQKGKDINLLAFFTLGGIEEL